MGDNNSGFTISLDGDDAPSEPSRQDSSRAPSPKAGRRHWPESSVHPDSVPQGLADQASGYSGAFADCGSTDTVPAMLAPGEFELNRSAASNYGSKFLDAVNSMRIPRDYLANLVSAPVSHFATGGAVGRIATTPEAGRNLNRGGTQILM